MKRTAWTLVIGLAVILPTVTSLQAQLILNKKSVFTVVVPAAALARVGTKSGWDTVSPIYGFEIVRAPDGQPMPKDKPDWRASGFPMLLEVKFEKVDQKDGLTIVEYRSLGTPGAFTSGSVPGVVIKFRMAPGLKVEEMLRPFVMGGKASNEVQTYLTDTYRLIASRVFTGAIANVAEPERLALVALAHVTAKGIGLTAESYKDNTYFAVDLEDDGNVYNDLKLNEGQRVSKVTNERLLTVIKAFAVPLRTSSLIYGVKLHTLIDYKDFLKASAIPAKDDVSLYAPSELIRKFADADITSQEFVDGCVVIVNGNRVKVVLAGA